MKWAANQPEAPTTLVGRLLELVPFFRSPASTATVLSGRVLTDEGGVVSRFSIGVSGADGRIVLKTFGPGVKSAVEGGVEVKKAKVK